MDDSSSTYYGLYVNLKDESTNKTKEKNLNSYFIDKIRTTIKSLLSDINNDLVKTFLKELDKLNEEEIKNKISSLTIENEEIVENIEKIKNEIKKNYWMNLLPKYKFISFSSFKDVLSDNVLFSELDKNKQAENILKVANIDIEKLSKVFSEDDEVALDDMQTEYQEIVSEKFKEIFQQTDENFKLKIRFGTSKKDIIFLTQDKTSNTKSINLSQRSDGFKWYLSLYLTLYEYLEEIDADFKNILLLDEPNLYLHPGAQKNLLYNVFYKDFSNVQVIYTTHSPYMIDINNSFSIRIVEKKEQTKVYNSTREYALCHDKMKDVDTVTPLLSALDLSISNDLMIDIKDKLFVVEGIQDVYTLKALIKKLDYEKKMKNIKFISGTSSEKVPYVYSYLYGMGYNVFTLVDNDKSGNKANKANKANKILADGDEHEELYSNLLTYDIINETNSEKFLLENLFSEQDLENFIP